MRISISNARVSVREMTALAALGALMFALKLTVAALPNIHPVAMLVILAALHFSWRSLYAVAIYVLLEGLMFGFSLWWVSYLYAWPLLVVLTILLRRSGSRMFWACLAGGFGLCFGALCSIPYFFIGGVPMAFSYWISGIPFDLLHCGGNFAVTFALLPVLQRLMERIAPAGRAMRL